MGPHTRQKDFHAAVTWKLLGGCVAIEYWENDIWTSFDDIDTE